MLGPTLVVTVPVAIGPSCRAALTFWVRGDAPAALDREGASIVPQQECPQADPVTGTLAVDHDQFVAEFAFDDAGGLLADSVQLGPAGRASLRPVWG